MTRSISPSDAKHRLFRKDRPQIRAYVHPADHWILWAAYDLGAFPSITRGMSRHKFEKLSVLLAGQHSSVLLVEDRCRWFKDGRGPVALVTVNNFGWRIEPSFEFFRWATPRMRLRASVAFFQMAKKDKAVGVCLLRTLEDGIKLAEHMKLYGVLYPCGKIVGGTPSGDEYLFSIKGRRVAEENMKKAA